MKVIVSYTPATNQFLVLDKEQPRGFSIAAWDTATCRLTLPVSRDGVAHLVSGERIGVA